MYFKSTRFLLCLDYLSDSNEENAVGFFVVEVCGVFFVFVFLNFKSKQIRHFRLGKNDGGWL